MNNSTLPLTAAIRRACVISGMVVAVAIVVDGFIMLFIQSAHFREPRGSSIVALALAEDGEWTGVVYSHSIYEIFDQPQYSLATRSPGAVSFVFHSLPEKNRAKCLAGHPKLPLFFVGTWNGGVYALDVAGKETVYRRLGEHPDGYISGLYCSPAGNLVVATGLRHIVAWNSESGRILWRRPHDIACLCFAAKSSRLFCGLKRGEIVELDPARGDIVATIPVSSPSIRAISASPEGLRVASVSSNGELALTRVATGSSLWTNSQTVSASPSFTSDGRFLLTAEGEGDDQLVVLREANSGAQLAVSRAANPINGIARGANGAFLIWGRYGPVLQSKILNTQLRVELTLAQIGFAF